MCAHARGAHTYARACLIGGYERVWVPLRMCRFLCACVLDVCMCACARVCAVVPVHACVHGWVHAWLHACMGAHMDA